MKDIWVVGDCFIWILAPVEDGYDAPFEMTEVQALNVMRIYVETYVLPPIQAEGRRLLGHS